MKKKETIAERFGNPSGYGADTEIDREELYGVALELESINAELLVELKDIYGRKGKMIDIEGLQQLIKKAEGLK